MRTRITTTLFAALIIGLATLANTQLASAQCATIRVFNNTGCDLRLCLYDGNGNLACIDIRAVGNPFIFAFTGPFTPLGAVSAGKNKFPFNAGGCTDCFLLPGSFVPTGCCAVVCYDPITCTINVNSCPAPCPQ